MNTGNDGDAGDGARSISFRELKRKARAVKARPRRKQTGGRGSAPGAGPETHIDILASKNILQKDSTASPSEIHPPISDETPHVSVAVSLTREDRWRSDGDIQAIVRGRSLNPRILEILLPNGGRGSAIVKPDEHKKFGAKKPVWVRKDDRGKHWLVVGRYSQWGVRCE
jgi:hypothetical protein